MDTTHDSHDPTTTPAGPKRHRSALSALPFLGLILFAATAAPLLANPPSDWREELLQNGVVYLIGWAGIGAGISHLLFAKKTSTSIGWTPSPFETEVGFADLAMGIAGVMASGQPTSFWFAVIVVNAIFRVGCGIGHVRDMVQRHNLATNNTKILLVDFGVPAFLLLGWFAWM
jgi:hypothetical protein